MRNKYWGERARQRMDDYHKDSDRVIGKILESYQAAIEEINAAMQKILNTYSKDAKLSMEEAKKYLTIGEKKEFIDNLKTTIAYVPDEELKREMLRQINAPAYRARLTKLQAIKEKLNVECKKLADIQVRNIEKGLMNTAKTAYYRTMFDMQQMTGYGFSFAEISVKQVEEILKNKWSRKHFSKRIWGNTEKLSSELEHVLTKGFMNGASVQRMTKDIADKMQVGEFAAARLIRTETTYVANSAELEAYKEAGVEKFQFLATLDLRTSDICREHDGKIYDLKEA
ncbi:minor capsid protein [Clostridium thermarum]|uniref:minor capsid protein n=1 Tax=Clostridium thermarum TaxID=1716543 RepID=UPI0011231A0F|nr:minor capsid protein [Clostridium thermarum]